MLQLAILFVSLLQPPAPTPLEPSDPKQDQTAKADDDAKADKQPSPPPPSIDDNVKAIQDEGPHKSQADNVSKAAPSDWWLQVNTWAVTGFTFVLMITTALQAWLMYHEMRATRDAARAAIDTVNQMRLEQRTFVKIAVPQIIVKAGLPTEYEYSVQNVGNSPAMIIRMRSGGFICATEDDISDVAELIKKFPTAHHTNRRLYPQERDRTERKRLTPETAEKFITAEPNTRLVVAIAIVFCDPAGDNYLVRQLFEYRPAEFQCVEYHKHYCEEKIEKPCDTDGPIVGQLGNVPRK